MPASALAVVIFLNGVPVDFGAVPPHLKPHLKDGIVIVPVRPILEGMGAKVEANDMTPPRSWYEVYVTYEGKETSLRAEYKKAFQQAEHLTWPAKHKVPRDYITSTPYSEVAPGASKIYRLMMPIGFLSNTFGFTVKWDGVKKLVKITTKE